MSRFPFFGTMMVAAVIGIGITPARAGVFTQALPDLRATTPLKHLVFIVEENRSFDHFFGTYPGADGFPSPLPCIPDMWTGGCDTPYHNTADSNLGGPYAYKYQAEDVDGGKMDGFVNVRETDLGSKCKPPGRGAPYPSRLAAPPPYDPNVDPDEEVINEGIHSHSTKCLVDVMGYHDGGDLPNTWAYAQNYVLFDHFYESIESYSLPAHLGLFSMWDAICNKKKPVSFCKTSNGGKIWGTSNPTPYLWADITYMLYKNNVSWLVYNDNGLDPLNKPFSLNGVQLIWNVLPGFSTVQTDGQVLNAEVNLQAQFYSDAANGTLPAVSWVLPDYNDSDHPQAPVSQGESYRTGLINAIEAGPDWSSTAIVILWDDVAGFYDHEPPPVTFPDNIGLGMRVPALLISPYSLNGYVDHQILSSDSLVKLVEDVFLNGERMRNSGWTDPRPDYRDESTSLGNILSDFNFAKAPRAPMLLPLHPHTTLVSNPQDNTAFDPSEPGPRIRR